MPVGLFILGFVIFTHNPGKSSIGPIASAESPTLSPANVSKTAAVQSAVDASNLSWTYDEYKKAMLESGRAPGITQDQFAKMLVRKKAADKIASDYLKQKFSSADPAVLQAFSEVPRGYFQYNYQKNISLANTAYEDKMKNVKPWAIGYGSALSDYLGQMYMTQLLHVSPGDTVLEIGTGSGYQSAILSRMVKNVYSIEIIKPLGDAVSKIFAPIGYANVHTKVGDGFYGWPEVKGGFDEIIVTAAAEYVPPALIAELKPGGRMLIPIGQPFRRGQILYVYTKDQNGKVHSRRDVGVYFIPMTGEIQASGGQG